MHLAYTRYVNISYLNVNENSERLLKESKDPPKSIMDIVGILHMHMLQAKGAMLDLHDIPRIIHQTYHTKSKIPEKVQVNFAEFAPDFQRNVYDDEDIRVFLKENFHSCVLEKFNSLKMGAHKADLFRYCILYCRGGIYIDIKTRLNFNLHEMCKKATISTVISYNPKLVYQGILSAPPHQAIFLSLISAIVRGLDNPPYQLFTSDFVRYLKFDTGSEPREGHLRGKKHSYYLYTEQCSKNSHDCEDGLDRYNLCCNIYEKTKRVFKTRYSDYPW